VIVQACRPHPEDKTRRGGSNGGRFVQSLVQETRESNEQQDLGSLSWSGVVVRNGQGRRQEREETLSILLFVGQKRILKLRDSVTSGRGR